MSTERDLAQIWMDKIVAAGKPPALNIIGYDGEVIDRVVVPAELVGEERLAWLNAYIRDHHVHPDLREADVTSLKREDTYRGRYPYVLEATVKDADGKVRPEHQLPAYTRADGAQYDLTSHLDYKYVTSKMYEGKDGALELRDDPDDPYPYLRGMLGVRNAAIGRATWTTLGSGELAQYRHYDKDGNLLHPGANNAERPDSSSPSGAPAPLLPLTQMAASRAAAEEDALVEIEESEYTRLSAIKQRWEACAALREEFCTALGEETVVEAAARCTIAQLKEWAGEVMTALNWYNTLQRYVLDELIARLETMSRALGSVTSKEV